MRRSTAAVGSALFFLLAPGVVARQGFRIRPGPTKGMVGRLACTWGFSDGPRGWNLRSSDPRSSCSGGAYRPARCLTSSAMVQ